MLGSKSKHGNEPYEDSPTEVSDKILTIPNFISFIRLCLIPAFFISLSGGHNIIATLLFALAASTDWIDGQVARRTHSVSKLGQLLDPTVDRLLIFSGVVGLLMVGRLPLWIVFVVVLRDAIMLCGGAYLLKRYKIRIPVVFAGKLATASLMFGFVLLLLNWPLISGLGLVSASWLPGFNDVLAPAGIWFVYIGLVLSLSTAGYYLYTAYRGVKEKKDSLQKTDRSDT